MQSFLKVDIQALAVAPLSQDARGNKRAAITLQGKAATFRFPRLRSPFGASLWQDAEGSRKNIAFSCTPDVQAFCEQLDDQILRIAVQRSQELFGQKMGLEALQALYTPLLRPSKDEAYPPTVRAKITLAGRKTVQCYDASCHPRPPVDDWRCDVEPALCLTQLWFQHKSFGAILDVTACKIYEEDVSCPFTEAEDVPRIPFCASHHGG
jgi:hypothetical protein